MCVYPCVLICVLMIYSGSKEGVSLPEVTVNVSGKVLDSPEMDEWDDKQVCCVLCVFVCGSVFVCLCASGGGGLSHTFMSNLRQSCCNIEFTLLKL